MWLNYMEKKNRGGFDHHKSPGNFSKTSPNTNIFTSVVQRFFSNLHDKINISI